MGSQLPAVNEFVIHMKAAVFEFYLKKCGSLVSKHTVQNCRMVGWDGVI